MRILKEQIEVMQAADEGKEIEVENAPGCWLPLQVLHFNWKAYDYRVKGELEGVFIPKSNSMWAGWHVSKEGWLPNWSSSGKETFTHENLDALHTASLKARGITAMCAEVPEGKTLSDISEKATSAIEYLENEWDY